MLKELHYNQIMTFGMVENETKMITNFVIMIDFFINKCNNK